MIKMILSITLMLAPTDRPYLRMDVHVHAHGPPTCALR
jgi:hypothetical protein